ncbi:SulP family inorganic anion transporter [Chloroflexota bacterium]
MTSIKKLALEIWGDFRSARLVPGLTSGLVVGLVEVIIAISFAALIFAGELSGFVVNGIGFALLGAIITGVSVALMAAIPGTVSGNQDAPAAILAVMAAAIIAAMPADATGLETFSTVIITIALTTLLCGLFFLGLGYFNLGGLVRYLPYPVVGGFLAGTGWLLVTGSINMMTGITPTISGLSVLFQVESLLLWLPGLVFAGILLVILNRYNHFLLLPGLVFGAILSFYLFIWLSGSSIAEVSAQGWLLGPFPDGNFLQPLPPLSTLAQVNWGLVLAQSGSMAIILVISAISLLLNASGLELAAKADMDLNHELRAAGTGNLLAGFFAGFVGFHQLSLSAMNLKLGAKTRLTGLIAAGVCLAALIAGTNFISLMPKFVLGGLLLFLGLTFIYEWVYQAWFNLPRTDYFVILLILFVIATVGFLQGVAIGILATVILFTINYSQVEVIKHSLTVATYRSTVDRPKLHKRLLRRYGKQVLILELQGYIFFGTANQLLEQIRAHITDYAQTRLCFLLLDFSQVTGIDSSVVLSFRKMNQLVQNNQASIILTGLSGDIETSLRKSGLLDLEEASFLLLPDLDDGIRWCERQLLQSTGALDKETPRSLQDQLKELTGDNELISRTMNYLEMEELPAGMHLIQQGDSPGAVYFLEQGLVTAQLEISGEKPRRLNTMSSENLVGELGFYLGSKRNASVVTETHTTLYRLTAEALKDMESQDPEAAALIHKYFAQIMAEKLSHLMSTVESLMR